MIHNTRIAPSPTGDMHLGTARTAYFNWLAARASGGKFILRIDDTDNARNRDEHVDVILNTMDWLGLDYDELHYQSRRTNNYKRAAQKLVDDQLAEVLENGAIALKDSVARDFLPESWADNIAGTIKMTDHDRKVTNQLILMKGDGTPSYNFATSLDDLEMGITHVIRGHDHISNTAKQLTIMNALRGGLPVPQYSHIGLIFANKKKLSKRDSAASLLYYKDLGYSPDALLNFMLRLGWAERDGKTIPMIPKEKAIDLFLSHGRMRNQSANMDMAHLNSMQRKYKAILS
jgi:glutamyl-tRNA synthetase